MLNKRIFRELRVNKARYLAVFILMMVGLAMVIENIIAVASIENAMNTYNKDYKVEDGEFSVYQELSEDTVNGLEKNKIILEEQFYKEYESENSSNIVRVFQNREKINLLNLIQGKKASKDTDIVVDRKYAQAHNLEVGDDISVGNVNMKISGIGIVPDYVSIKQNISDLIADSNTFGIAFVTEDGYRHLSEGGKELQSEEVQYSYILNGDWDSDKLKEYLEDADSNLLPSNMGISSNLISFINADDNSRISGYDSDINSTKSVCIMMGVLFALLLAFVIALFISHGIEQESAVVGTLYAVGLRKSELLRYYIKLPLIVILMGGLCGTALGYGFSRLAIASFAGSYTFPDINIVYTMESLVYGVIVPLIFGAIVNVIIINNKLKRQPLDLISKRQKNNKISRIKLRNIKFVNIYRIRQLLKEKVIYLILFIGVFYSIVIMVFSFTIYSAIGNYQKNCTDDVKWNYMYTLKYTDDNEDYDAEKSYAEELKVHDDIGDSDVSVTLLGVDNKSKYFDFVQKCDKESIYISDCAALKFGWKDGDEIVLKNVTDKKDYTFTVKATVSYSAGLFVFIPIENMREIFDTEDDYYNTLFSDEELTALEHEMIFSQTTREDIEEAGKTLMSSMSVTIGFLLGASVIIFIAVMYLLLKLITDRSSFGISLMKIFGYGDGEIQKIFIQGNVIVVFLASILALTAGKAMIDQIYPLAVTDIDLGFNTSFSIAVYAIQIGIILLAYCSSSFLLNRKLKKYNYTELLKERE